jgi:hypothetical protein
MMLTSLNSKNRPLSESLLESVSTIGEKSYLFYLLLYLLITILMLFRVEFFPDYEAYAGYIDSNTSYAFYKEPLSALTMMLISWLGLSAKGYYIFAWIFVSVLTFIIPLAQGRRYIVLSVFLLINPFSLILFETPRSFMAYPFFLLALVLATRRKIILSIIAITFHSFSGLYGAGILYAMKFSKNTFSVLLFLALIIQFFLASMFKTHYIVSGVVHGQGRLILLALFISAMIFLSIKKGGIFTVLLAVFFYTFLAYSMITPAARLIPYLFAVVVLYSFIKFNKKDSIIMIHLLYLSYIFISFNIVLGGKFGYG